MIKWLAYKQNKEIKKYITEEKNIKIFSKKILTSKYVHVHEENR
jgi:hypothetical protein